MPAPTPSETPAGHATANPVTNASRPQGVSRPWLGTCYYPEHWDRSLWRQDAQRMADLGLSRIRIGEFAWAQMEPAQGQYDWGWLDDAIAILHDAGLSVILGTPTATPPKWLIDAHPDILAWDHHLRPRRFGSRRHYCFSSPAYARETSRIVTAMATRYGDHPAIVAWQTDNEYGCHDTVRSYSPDAAAAFRSWLRQRYGDIGALNAAWGALFWSQAYQDFSAIDLPAATVTEPNPTHVLDFYRFSSDQVVAYNRLQTDIIRRLSPGREITHNFMGFFTDFDHFALGADIDVAAWDSYPLGFLDTGHLPASIKKRYLRQGHPDFAGLHHDLYRAVGRGRFCVMEQQPGPVNWAHHNPAPLSGMVRLWTHEAIAHGAEGVSYFRWRQAPFAQEQTHAGLLRPDNAPAPAFAEVLQTQEELTTHATQNSTTGTATNADAIPGGRQSVGQRDVAIIFSYEAQWLSEIQRHGAGWTFMTSVYDWYGALRRAGCSIDFVQPGGDLSGYRVIVAPWLPIISDAMLEQLRATTAHVIFGPRSGARTECAHIPPNLAPGPLQELLPLTVTHCETLPADHCETGRMHGVEIAGRLHFDHVETALTPLATRDDGAGMLFRNKNYWMLTTQPDDRFMLALLTVVMAEGGVELRACPDDLRVTEKLLGDGVSDDCTGYIFNYGVTSIDLPPIFINGMTISMGSTTLPPAGVAQWRKR